MLVCNKPFLNDQPLLSGQLPSPQESPLNRDSTVIGITQHALETPNKTKVRRLDCNVFMLYLVVIADKPHIPDRLISITEELVILREWYRGSGL